MLNSEVALDFCSVRHFDRQGRKSVCVCVRVKIRVNSFSYFISIQMLYNLASKSMLFAVIPCSGIALFMS